MRPIRIPIASTAVGQRLYGRAGRLVWYSFAEMTGAASASLALIDGQDQSGSLIMPVNLLANESTREWTGNHAIPFDGGLYLFITSGTVDGSLVVVDELDWVDWIDAIAVMAARYA